VVDSLLELKLWLRDASEKQAEIYALGTVRLDSGGQRLEFSFKFAMFMGDQ